MNLKKLNKIKIIAIIVCLLFMTNFIYADDTIDKGLGIIDQLNKAKEFATDILGDLTGKPPLLGALTGAFSGFNTYSKLGKVINLELERDEVNISGEKKDEWNDYIDDDLIFDYNKSMALIDDKNILDTEFIKTINPLDIKDTNSPTFRLGEDTEVFQVQDPNGAPVDVQKRGILFQDPNNTIKRASEFRYLFINYKKAKYKDKVRIKISAKDLGGLGKMLSSPFTSGVDNFTRDIVLKKLTNKDNKELKKYKNIEDIKQKFHLQFNSFVDENIHIEQDLLDCTTEDGLRLGTTGKEILPKVVLNWNFSEDETATAINGTTLNKQNWCDVDKNGVYCDSTQFTIELLNKINEINTYVKEHKSQFICPTPGVSQDLITDVNNVGITYLTSSYDESIRKVKVDYTIEGNFDVTMLLPAQGEENPYLDEDWFDLSITLYKKETDGSLVEKDHKIITIKGKDIYSGILTETVDLDLGFYPLETTDLVVRSKLQNFAILPIYNSNLQGVKSKEELFFAGDDDVYGIYLENLDIPQDNTLQNMFTTEATECQYDNVSTNIPLFARNITGNKFDQKLVEFDAYLMKDGYTLDFKKDFDEYYRTTFVLGVPDFYNTLEDSYRPLYKYFIDPDKFNFITPFSTETQNLILSGPGKYKVQIVIDYSDNWYLFNDAHQPIGNVTVKLEKELKPLIDSPLYYMPIDGLVGSTSQDARQGYGVDYIGDVVTIDQDTPGLETTGYISSNPINTVNVKEITKFENMNNGSGRGRILSLTTDSTHSNHELRYSPSRATPVVMKVNNINGDAYAFYKLSVGAPEGQGGYPANPGMSLTKWTGLGDCKDFTGTPILESFLGTPDLLASKSELAPHTQSQTFDYGVEWPEEINNRVGNVFLKTILYTPENYATGNGISVLSADSYSDDLTFFSPKKYGELNTQSNFLQSGKEIDLYNIFGSNYKIQSMKDIYNLVSEKKACINYDSTNLEIFYNPKKVSDALVGENTDAVKDFIDSKGKCISH